MNCGRHCTFDDYYHLVNVTDNYFRCLDRNDHDALGTKLDIYLIYLEVVKVNTQTLLLMSVTP